MTRLMFDDSSMEADPPVEPGGAPKRAEQVRDKLVQLIREGRLRDGQKLPTEPQLSEMFGVGRSTVREAVKALVGLGLVEMRPGLGAFVRRLSLSDLVRMVDGAFHLDSEAVFHVHEVRTMIEVTAAAFAATRHDEHDLRVMTDAILDYRLAEHAGDQEAMIDADLAFHAAVIAATGNPVLASVFDSISGVLREHRRQYGQAPDGGIRLYVPTEHEAIRNAIAGANPDEAANLMQFHMQVIRGQIERLANLAAPGSDDQGSHAGRDSRRTKRRHQVDVSEDVAIAHPDAGIPDEPGNE